MKHATAADIGSLPASEAHSRGFGFPGMPVGSVRSGGRRQPVVPGPLQVTNTPQDDHKRTFVVAPGAAVVV